jgi:tetratricopeptide (TPR) repeat protein
MHHTMSRTEKFLISLLFVLLAGLFVTPGALAQQAKNYQEAMAKGNQLLQQKKYLDAKAYFQMALRFKVHDPAATEKIHEVVKKLKAGESREEAYYNVIDRADGYYDKNLLDLAIKAYRQALTIIPGDSYALGRIKEIKRQQTLQKKKLAQYQRLLRAGDSLLSLNLFNASITAFEKAQNLFPGKTLAQDKIVLARQMQHRYQNRLKKAQKEVELAARYLLIRNYVDALRHYRMADSLVPGNPEVEKRIRQLQSKAASQTAYNKIADEADRLYVAKNYMAALEKYREAQKLWPENSYPADMIAKVNQQLTEQRKNLEYNYRKTLAQADSLFGLQEMQNARAQYNLALSLKPGEVYPQQQLKKIKAWFIRQQQLAQANYKALLRSADSLFNKGAYAAASERYRQARKTRPEDPYPPKKLNEIKAKLAAIAKQKEREAQYQALIAEANRLQAAGHFDLAIAKYKQAQLLKNSDAFAQSQIDKINALLAKMQKQKERDARYAKQIILGQKLLQQNQLEEAKKAYANALSIKPDEVIPKQKIHVIDSLIQQKIRAEQIEKEYNTAVAQGKALYAQKKFTEALAAFQNAHRLKPDDTYSGKMIQSIQTTLAAIARAKAIQQTYEESNAKADRLLKEQKYELAKAQYQNSLTIKPGESYPKKQITEINTTLQRLAKEREQRYAAALSKADNLFNSRHYRKALEQYQVAASIKPDEPYPNEQITACKTYIAQIVAEQTAKYNQAIAEADKLYKARIFDQAVRAYKKAEKAKPDKTYPAQMIKKITDYIEKNAIVDLIKEKTQLPANQIRKLVFKPLPVNVRKSNYVYIKAANLTGKPFRIIFTYGKDKVKNGGFFVQVPPGKKEQDFIIRIGIQYKWFSDDNNWIGIYPENNPVEISLVRISRSD